MFAPESIKEVMGTPSTIAGDSFGGTNKPDQWVWVMVLRPRDPPTHSVPSPIDFEFTEGFGGAPLPGEGVHPPKPPPHAGFPTPLLPGWVPCLGSYACNVPNPCTYGTGLGVYPL